MGVEGSKVKKVEGVPWNTAQKLADEEAAVESKEDTKDHKISVETAPEVKEVK